MNLTHTLKKFVSLEIFNLSKHNSLRELILMSEDGQLPQKHLSDVRHETSGHTRQLTCAVRESTPHDNASSGNNQGGSACGLVNRHQEQRQTLPLQETRGNQYSEDEVRAFLDQDRREINTDVTIDPNNLADAVMSYGSLEKIYKGSIVMVIRVTKSSQLFKLMEDKQNETLKKTMYEFLIKERKQPVNDLTVEVDELHLQSLESYFKNPEMKTQITYAFCHKSKEWFWSTLDSTESWYHCKTLQIPSDAKEFANHRPTDSSLEVLLKLASGSWSETNVTKACKLCEEKVAHPEPILQPTISPDMFSVTIKLTWNEKENEDEKLKAWEHQKKELLNSGLLEESEARQIENIDVQADCSDQTFQVFDILSKVVHRMKVFMSKAE